MNATNSIPDDSAECPICQRAGRALRDAPELEHLSPKELDTVIRTVQNSILKKNAKGESNMSDEKYVISKASFEDFYETQDNIVSIIAKIAQRIDMQDQVIMKFGAALSELIADEGDDEEYDDAEEFDIDDDSELVEDEVEVDDDEEDLEDEDDEEDEVSDEDVEEIIGKAERTAFEAGWKAAEAELRKEQGFPMNVVEASFGNLPVSRSESSFASSMNEVKKAAVFKSDLSDEDIAAMTPAQLNAWAKSQGI